MYLAYLDGGSASMLVSAVVAGFAGAMVVVKVWWHRVVGKFRRRQPTDVETPVSSDSEG